MRVFILGGSGLIGAAIVRNLVSAGHHVFALARNENSAAHLAVMGAWPIRGDIHNPGPWCDKLPVVDAVIHRRQHVIFPPIWARLMPGC